MKQMMGLLIRDLLERVRHIRTSVKKTSATYTELHDFAASTTAALLRHEQTLERLLQDPALEDERLAINFYRLYHLHATKIDLLEVFPVVVLSRYNETDHFFAGVVHKLVADIRYPLPTPLVVAASMNYYEAYTDYNLVRVTVGEQYTLLSWVDLFHELAHFIYRDKHLRFTLLGIDFRDEVQTFWRAVIRNAGVTRKDAEYVRLLEGGRDHWLDAWGEEFTADLVATYLVGGAYGWNHLKLAARIGNPPFSPALTDLNRELSDTPYLHPSDDARLAAIAQMLRQLGKGEEATQLDAAWQWYVNDLRLVKADADRSVCYPEVLIDEIVRQVIEGCERLGLVPCTQATPDSLPALLQEAWHRFREDAEGYHLWEQGRLASLFSRGPITELI